MKLIGIENIHHNPTLLALPAIIHKGQWGAEHDYRILHQISQLPEQYSDSGLLVSPFDLIIKNEGGSMTTDFSSNIVRLTRYSKLDQQRLIHRLKGVVPTPTYSLNGDCFLTGLPGDTTELWMKIPNGARGIGQYHLKADNPLALKKHLHNDSVEKLVITTDDVIVTPLGGIENQEGEGDDALAKVSPGSLLFQTVEDVAEEYRILTNSYGNIAIAHRRMREDRADGKFQQATYLADHDDIPEELHKRFQAVIQEIQANNCWMGMMSVDFFTRPDGSIGIFEFQPQTGHTSLTDDQVREWLVELLNSRT